MSGVLPHVEAQHEPLASENPAATNGAGNVVAWTQHLGAGPKLTPTFGDQLPPYPHGFGGTATPAASPLAAPTDLKIALVGTAPSSRMLAPFNDPSWTIWACSPGNQGVLPRVDAWFEIHSNLLWPENKHYGEPYIEFLKKLTCPVYMQDNSLVPNAQTFPRQQLVDEFGEDFYTSSFTWMMAMAIHRGAKEIALFGIDMASRDEYILQRPGFFFFRYLAQQRGIKVSAPHESDIMQSPGQYGYWEATTFGRKIMARDLELKQRLGQLRAQRDNMISQITYLEGAVEDLDYFKSIWPGVAKIN